jgi:hypothetical protein
MRILKASLVGFLTCLSLGIMAILIAPLVCRLLGVTVDYRALGRLTEDLAMAVGVLTGIIYYRKDRKRLVILISASLTINVALWLIDSPYFGPIGAPNLFILLTALLVIYPPVSCLSLFTNIRPFAAISGPEAVLVVLWNTFFWSLAVIVFMKVVRAIRAYTRAEKSRSNQSS